MYREIRQQDQFINENAVNIEIFMTRTFPRNKN